MLVKLVANGRSDFGRELVTGWTGIVGDAIRSEVVLLRISLIAPYGRGSAAMGCLASYGWIGRCGMHFGGSPSRLHSSLLVTTCRG